MLHQTLRITLALACPLVSAAAFAQGAGGTPPVQPQPQATVEPVACAPKLALYTGAKNAKILLKRQGAGNAVDPLRPLTPKPVTVVELVVDGRIAHAAGPNLSNLRRASLADIEAEQAVTWEKDGTVPPRIVRLVTEDGRAPFGELVFAGCQDAPAARPASRNRANPDRPGAERRPSPNLPQGAIPDNSLKLPKQ